jgi:phage head maturation protease
MTEFHERSTITPVTLGVPIESRDAGVDDPLAGRRMTGMVITYDRPTMIRDWLGEYEEIIRPGAGARSLTQRQPILQFDHGRHATIGSLPIGVPTWTDTPTGVRLDAVMFEAAALELLREALAAQMIPGMSFRFSVPEGGDIWTTRPDGIERREIVDMDWFEGGPVIWPAYASTSVDLREMSDLAPATDASEAEPDDQPESLVVPRNTNALQAQLRLRQIERDHR